MEFSEIAAKCWEIWAAGGWVMIPLVALAVMIYSSGLQLLLFMRRGNIQLGNESDWLKWIYAPEGAEGRAGEIIRYTQENVSSAKHVRNRFQEVRNSMLHNIERRLIFLNTLVATAPLMGLLGTVIGMLATFVGLATSGGGETVDVVSAGISRGAYHHTDRSHYCTAGRFPRPDYPYA